MKREIILTQDDDNCGISKRYLPIYEFNEDGEKAKRGTAIYDLGDERLLYNFSKFYTEFQELLNKHMNKLKSYEELNVVNEEDNFEKVRELYELNISGIKEMFELADKIFGEDFCKNCMGDSLNLKLLMRILSEIAKDIEETRSEKIEKTTAKYSNKKKKAGDIK